MAGNPVVIHLEAMGNWFSRTLSIFEEEDSLYKPKEEMMNLAQQVAHVAQTVDWFTEGSFREETFDMNFEKMMDEVNRATSFTAEMDKFKASIKNACEVWGSKSKEELEERLPENPIMGQVPRIAVLEAIADHTAHHRGYLAVYARLLGKTPPMPYMEG